LIDSLRSGTDVFDQDVGGPTGLDDEPSWVRERAAMERDAILLRWYEHAYVPGLLQTEAYARAVFSRSGLLPHAEVEKRLAARMERRRILDVDDPPQVVAVLDEEALRRHWEAILSEALPPQQSVEKFREVAGRWT
jgi:hypothetical protein